MSLLDLWRSSPSHIRAKQVDQVIAFAGSGRLTDGDSTSIEFRELLAEIESDLLARFAEECLAKKFENNGLALQDIVNEIGRRLGFVVATGRYRGVPGQIGNDGLWSADGHSIIVEVKTTDAYRIGLNTIAEYRAGLVRADAVQLEKSSILIVVGRQDTGELEEQVRGSRYAWDIRLVSVDRLVSLLKLKERADDPGLGQRIRNILIPHEFTRVDGIIDMMFTTAEDARVDQLEPSDLVGANEADIAPLPPHVNEACVDRVARHLNVRLIRQSRTVYIEQGGKITVVCLVSKQHERVTPFFWFGFHPYHKSGLEVAAEGYLALGCGSDHSLLLIPYRVFAPWLDGMNVTVKPERSYWHVQILSRSGRLELHQKEGQPVIDVTQYLIPNTSSAIADAGVTSTALPVG